MRRSPVEQERPGVSRGLLAVLIVAAVAAGGYWVYQYATRDGASAAGASDLTFTLWCTSCNEAFELKGKEATRRKRDGDNVECPKCKKMTGTFRRPREEVPGVALP